MHFVIDQWQLGFIAEGNTFTDLLVLLGEQMGNHNNQ